MLPVQVLGTALVGYSEELVTRGLLFTGAREAGRSESGAFLPATTLFAVLHELNAFYGQSPPKTASGSARRSSPGAPST